MNKQELIEALEIAKEDNAALVELAKLFIEAKTPRLVMKARNRALITLSDQTKKLKSCFSCEKEFQPEENNDRDEGWFCDDCLTNPNE